MVRRQTRALVLFALSSLVALAACGGSASNSGERAAHGSARTGPGPAAREVCEPMVRDSVPSAIGLPVVSAPISAVRGDTFSCRYEFEGGALEMSVRDLHTRPKANEYFRGARSREGVNDALSGLAEGGFTKSDGSVVAIKDAMVLTVDVTALPPTRVDKTGIAIDLAATVLGCWTGGS